MGTNGNLAFLHKDNSIELQQKALVERSSGVMKTISTTEIQHKQLVKDDENTDFDKFISEVYSSYPNRTWPSENYRARNVSLNYRSSTINTCSPSENIVFVKTHKTGGTTVTNMLLRYAEKAKLDVGLPIAYHWEMAGYPSTFDSRLIDPKMSNYNVLCHHMKFNKEKVKKIMSASAEYVTILRDPVQNFESAFGFFKDYPYPEWKLDGEEGMEKFLNNPENYYNQSTPWYFRAKNYMSF